MARLFRAKEDTKPLAHSSVPPLESPFGDLACDLSDSDLKDTAFEIFAAACPTTTTNTPSAAAAAAPSLQRSLTSSAASKAVKKAFVGMRCSVNKTISSGGGGGSGSVNSTSKSKKSMVRVQMGVSEESEARVKRALLRISAAQGLVYVWETNRVGDEAIKVLAAGLLLHPHLPLEKSDSRSQRLREIIQEASRRPIETGQNSEEMQALRAAVMSLASRSFHGSVAEACHWADGFPLNLQLYQKLLEACFDVKKQTLLVNEIDEILVLLKKTWPTLGINQMLHNLCFTWVLFSRFVATSHVDLLVAADDQLTEVAKDAKSTKDPVYGKILSSIVNSILGWVEKRLLAYHETFHLGNIDSMERLVSLGVASAKILVEDISQEYRRKKKGEDVTRNRVDTYIRSSIRTAFAQASTCILLYLICLNTKSLNHLVVD
ncbi:hypothetical protein Sjap_019597 [Stephania japonica]|uniref:Uncharacterized protein n=1 Tax=Stephania japonica TaxID=461633 RepID=A0AAP0HUV6_9MAGN